MEEGYSEADGYGNSKTWRRMNERHVERSHCIRALLGSITAQDRQAQTRSKYCDHKILEQKEK